jgi:hypothetical protein
LTSDSEALLFYSHSSERGVHNDGSLLPWREFYAPQPITCATFLILFSPHAHVCTLLHKHIAKFILGQLNSPLKQNKYIYNRAQL